jgi:hypothetical protein
VHAHEGHRQISEHYWGCGCVAPARRAAGKPPRARARPAPRKDAFGKIVTAYNESYFARPDAQRALNGLRRITDHGRNAITGGRARRAIAAIREQRSNALFTRTVGRSAAPVADASAPMYDELPTSSVSATFDQRRGRNVSKNCLGDLRIAPFSTCLFRSFPRPGLRRPERRCSP